MYRKTCGLFWRLRINLDIESSLEWLVAWASREITDYLHIYKNPKKHRKQQSSLQHQNQSFPAPAPAVMTGLALFERSEFSQTPAGLSNAAYRRSRATNPARLSFAYFSLAKQRTSESPAGATPGLPARSTNQTQGKWHARLGAHPNATRPPWRTPARVACARPYPSRRESQK